MSSNTVAPMSCHIFWSDGTETHLQNLFTQMNQIPKNKKWLVIVTFYLDQNGQETYSGHFIGGFDRLYVKIMGSGPNNMEYAVFNSSQNTNDMVNVYELKGYGVESVKQARIRTFNNNDILIGGIFEVTMQQYEEAMNKAMQYPMI